MIYFLFIVLVIVVFAKMSDFSSSVERLRSEVNKLKQQINAGQGTTPARPVSESQNIQSGSAPLSTQQAPSSPQYAQTVSRPVYQQTQRDDVVLAWIKENWLLKLGVLMILVGFGWFVSYAFMHDWIGPVGRIAIGIVAGALIAIFGTMRLGKNETQGILFTILGSALVIISVLAGQYFYQFFSPMLVLGLIFLVSFYVSLTALAYSTEKLAIYGLILALLAPIFSHVTFDLDPVAMYLYLLIISIATVWISVIKGWRIGNPIGIVGVLLYSLPIITSYGGGGFATDTVKYTTLILAYVISFLYLFVSAWSLIREKDNTGENNGATSNDVFLTIVSTILILGFTMGLVPTIFQSLVLAVWMLIFAISGFIVFQTTKNEKLFYIHSLVAILFLAIATSVELSGKTLIIAFALEASIISIASFLVTNKIKISQAFGALMVVPMLMSLESVFSSNWSYSSGMGIFHVDFAVLLLMGVLLGVLGFFYKANRPVGRDVSEPDFCHVALILSSVYFYVIIWLASHAVMFNQDSAVLISLFIYTVVGLGTYFTGLFNMRDVLKKYGATLLILVVLRLVLVDVWHMELAMRVVTFIILGVMFISTAFISKRQKEEHMEIGGEINNNGSTNN